MDKKSEKPKLVVFDLDYTLWPFWIDTHYDAPFTKISNTDVKDCHGRQVPYYQAVPRVLQNLKRDGIMVGVASRTSCTSEARELIQCFEWDQYFDYVQIYPGGKTKHLTQIKEDSGIEFHDMIFFDDEHRNIRDVSKLAMQNRELGNMDPWITEMGSSA
ncbi:magnesium-dependent phosphatase 1-like isoform X2 [Ostrea edulis]|uniref:magnesium-dependent phosphatase 1-like isoform X2 n=1 Tax=Ostrea edulis TaxID=37623 RepID=UPI00209473F0|nr:magnesium-dependent phosphatase 1-like isoform X2 [Ostrea edulis]XP_055996257.1 magnesium-dependent phosphatase 1-like isoform X2 [Ostrea edulis]